MNDIILTTLAEGGKEAATVAVFAVAALGYGVGYLAKKVLWALVLLISIVFIGVLILQYYGVIGAFQFEGLQKGVIGITEIIKTIGETLLEALKNQAVTMIIMSITGLTAFVRH